MPNLVWHPGKQLNPVVDRSFIGEVQFTERIEQSDDATIVEDYNDGLG